MSNAQKQIMKVEWASVLGWPELIKSACVTACKTAEDKCKTCKSSSSSYSSRLGWAGLVKHPFWQGELSSLSKEFAKSQDLTDTGTPATQSSCIEHNVGSVLGRIKGMESIDQSVSRLDIIESGRPGKYFFYFFSPSLYFKKVTFFFISIV